MTTVTTCDPTCGVVQVSPTCVSAADRDNHGNPYASIEVSEECPPGYGYGTVHPATGDTGSGSPAICCLNAINSDPACAGLCAASPACGAVLATHCFAPTTHCLTDPTPPPSGSGVTPTTCPILASNDPLQPICASWCACNPAQCLEAQRAYCATAEAEDAACACISPNGRAWGSVTYEQIVSLMATHADSFPAECVWPPCVDRSGAVFPYPTSSSETACPPVNNLCLNYASNVHIDHLVAGTVDINTCSGGGGGGNPGGVTGAGALPFGTALKRWLQTHRVATITSIALVACIIGTLIWLVFKPLSEIEKATEAITRDRLARANVTHMTRVIGAMRASKDPSVRAAGERAQLSRALELNKNCVKLAEQKKRVATLTASGSLKGAALAGVQAELEDNVRALDELQKLSDMTCEAAQARTAAAAAEAAAKKQRKAAKEMSHPKK